MSRLLLLLVLIVACIVGMGYYLEWFHVGSESDGDKVHINVTVDKDKIQEDKKKALEKVHDLGHPLKDKAAAPAGKDIDQAGPTGQPPRD
jgi:acetolactate synthase regulatory subunit